jgi:tRNA pseudouridine38-40 synthase
VNNDLKKIVLVVEYDGTEYCGFQYQINDPTIQDELEKAVRKLTGEKLRIAASSRTDSGVHARGQVVCFRTSSGLGTETFVKGLNYYLPQDIAVKESYKVDNGFNVQSEAVSREYRYIIYNGSVRSPLNRRFTLHVDGELDIEAMNGACGLMIGKNDMASFVTELKESTVKTTFRTIYKAQVYRDKALVVFEIEAKSFLPHQVRNTVGALIRVGQGKLSVSDFKDIMEAKKPGLAGPTVPATGLYLEKVNYPRPLGDYYEDL